MLKEGIKTRRFFSFLQHVLLVFIPSFSMHFLFLIRPSVYTSCFYSFLQLVVLVFYPSFSLYFLLLFLPSACSSCLYSFLQHVLLFCIPSFILYFLFLSEGIKTRSTKWRKEYKQEVHAEGRNKSKKYKLKDG
jgi:hypothetical protein